MRHWRDAGSEQKMLEIWVPGTSITPSAEIVAKTGYRCIADQPSNANIAGVRIIHYVIE